MQLPLDCLMTPQDLQEMIPGLVIEGDLCPENMFDYVEPFLADEGVCPKQSKTRRPCPGKGRKCPKQWRQVCPAANQQVCPRFGQKVCPREFPDVCPMAAQYMAKRPMDCLLQNPVSRTCRAVLQFCDDKGVRTVYENKCDKFLVKNTSKAFVFTVETNYGETAVFNCSLSNLGLAAQHSSPEFSYSCNNLAFDLTYTNAGEKSAYLHVKAENFEKLYEIVNIDA